MRIEATLRSCALAIALTVAMCGAASSQSYDSRLRGHSQAAPLSADGLLNYNPREIEDGIRVGSFLLQSDLDLGVSYDSNVYRSNQGRADDYVLHVAPNAGLYSRWSRHSLNVNVGGRFNHYVDEARELGGRFNASATGIVDVRRDLKILPFVSYRYGQDEFGDGEAGIIAPRFGLLDQVSYHVVQTGVSVAKHFNRLWVQLGGNFTYSDYDDNSVTQVSGFSRDARDGQVVEGQAKIGYEISPNTSVFVESRYNERDYRERAFDSTGYRFLGGIAYDLSRLTRAEIAAGYMVQESDLPGGVDLDSWTMRASVMWEASPFVRLAMFAFREIGAPNAYYGFGEQIVTSAGVRADYTIRRDVILTSVLGYTWGDAAERSFDQERLLARATAEYFFLPRRSVYLTYQYDKQISSSDQDGEFARSLVTAGLKMRF